MVAMVTMTWFVGWGWGVWYSFAFNSSLISLPPHNANFFQLFPCNTSDWHTVCCRRPSHCPVPSRGKVWQRESNLSWSRPRPSHSLPTVLGRAWSHPFIEMTSHSLMDFTRGWKSVCRTPWWLPLSQSSVQPIIEPITRKPVIEPISRKPVIEPISRKPVIEPISSEPVISELVIEPIISESIILQPIISKPVIEPHQWASHHWTSRHWTNRQCTNHQWTNHQWDNHQWNNQWNSHRWDNARWTNACPYTFQLGRGVGSEQRGRGL